MKINSVNNDFASQDLEKHLEIEYEAMPYPFTRDDSGKRVYKVMTEEQADELMFGGMGCQDYPFLRKENI